MPSSNVCWGIEIGAGAIKAIKIEADGQRVNVLDYAYIEHPKVLSTPGVDANDVLRVSLGRFVNEADLSGAAIAVSVPGHSAFARFAKLPPVEPKKVPDIVKFEAMQQIPFPLEQVEWDYQTFQSPDSPEVEVGIFAITRERINERLQLLTDLGITPNFVTLSPLAVFNSLAYDEQFTEKTPGTIIVDVGTTSTDLIICEAGRVWIRTFGIGGHNFTDALVNTFKIGYPAAEKLKREAEESKHARQVFQAMRPVFTDLAQDITRSIGYYTNLHRDAKLERIIAVGSTFHLPGIRKFLQQQVGMTVYRVEQFKRANLDSLKDEERQKKLAEMPMVMSTAYGLALQGLGLATIGANLMPVPMIRETMWREKVKWFGLAAGLAVATGAAMFVRPTLDYLQAGGNPAPASIGQAMSRFQEVMADATQRGLDQAMPPDYRAANMVALLEARGVYSHLVDDLGQMFADAENKAASWRTAEGREWRPPEGMPAMQLKDFAARYLGLYVEMDPSADPSTAAPAEGNPKIRLTLEVTTSRPSEADANSFMIKTVDEWLTKNASRAGVPYRILPPTGRNYWRRSGVATPAPEMAEEAPTTPEQGGGDSGGEPQELGGGKGRPGLRNPNDPANQIMRVGGGSSGGGSGDAPMNAEALALAPLSKVVTMPKPNAPTYTMTVTWTVEILPPAGEKTEEKGS